MGKDDLHIAKNALGVYVITLHPDDIGPFAMLKGLIPAWRDDNRWSKVNVRIW